MHRLVIVMLLLASLITVAANTFARVSEASASAPSPKQKSAAGFTEYDRVRQALARDSTEGVAKSASALEAELQGVSGPGKAEAAEAAKAAGQLAAKNSLEGARKSFKVLSASYIQFLLQTKATGELARFHCPMADADWVQADHTAANPYFGTSMLHCGAVVPWKEDR